MKREKIEKNDNKTKKELKEKEKIKE